MEREELVRASLFFVFYNNRVDNYLPQILHIFFRIENICRRWDVIRL